MFTSSFNQIHYEFDVLLIERKTFLMFNIETRPINLDYDEHRP